MLKKNKWIHFPSSHKIKQGLGLSSDRDMPNRFPEIVRANIPNASDEAIQTLLSMYPFPKEIPETLAWEFITDIIWSCTTGNIAEAYGKIARRFLFSIPPATHGLDLSCKKIKNTTLIKNAFNSYLAV